MFRALFGDTHLSNNRISTISNKYPTYRDDLDKHTNRWLAGKRLDDNAEGLWRIHNKLYDLNDFVDRHPGGSEWLTLTKGIDITEQFETHHISNAPEQMLSKFYVREAKEPRNYKLTFKDDGFYRTLKRRVASKIGGLDQHPVLISKYVSDMMLSLTFMCAIIAMKGNNFYLATASALFMTWTIIVAHNYFHQKDNWRRFCFNLSLMSCREWRVSHAMSHHLYTNSYHDLEISMFEPFFKWIPEQKTWVQRVGSWIYTPIVYSVIYKMGFVLRFTSSFSKLHWDDAIAFTLPLSMYIFGKSEFFSVVIMWIYIITASSFFFGIIGLNAGHHHPENAHEGDELPSLDFGIFQMASVIDRKDAKQSQFMVLTHFGEHTLHHLFPTLDHGLLPQLNNVFLETCKEFEIELREYPWFELIKGQFQQLARTQIATLSK